MKLPKLDVPIYETKLISNGKTVKFRPFLVKEQKLFLMASQSEDVKETMDIIKQVLSNCILSDDVSVEDLPSFDLEYLFLNLRAKSVGETVELKYTCNNTITDDEGNQKNCGNMMKFKVDLMDIKPEKNKNHTNNIQLDSKLGVVLKYPSISLLSKIENIDNIDIFELILDCIESIYDNENIYYAKDVSREDLSEFLESMQQQDFQKIEEFFKTMPKLQKTINFKCSKCGYKEDINLEGISHFFG